MSKDVFYITTPLYYVNDVPHIGHAYATIGADVQARFQRACGREVFFVTGSDEHGQKIEKAATEKGLSPLALADEVVEGFKKLWVKLDISNDDFVRTTEARHDKAVKKFFQAVFDAGFLEKRPYRGWYCVHEENFWPENQLLQPGNLCPDCRRPTQENVETNFFFKQSEFRLKIKAHLEANPDFVFPTVRRNELLGSYLDREDGVPDQSVTRANLKWGVPTPVDPDQVIYVWFDALIGYLTAAGYGSDDARFARTWPASVHLIGKDILRFHAVLWPAMLMAAGIPLPERVVGTGIIMNQGQKMSKSLGNAIDPWDWAGRYGVDVFRYYLLRELPFGNDGSVSDETFGKRYNTELANDLGNLCHRTLSMLEKYFEGKVPEEALWHEHAASAAAEDLLVTAGRKLWHRYASRMEALAYNEALEEVFALVRTANQYVDEQAPWKQAKDPAKKAGLAFCMYNLVESLRLVALCLQPFMPSTSMKLLGQLGIAPEKEFGPGSRRPGLPLAQAAAWGGSMGGTLVAKGLPLFPRDEPVVEKVNA